MGARGRIAAFCGLIALLAPLAAEAAPGEGAAHSAAWQLAHALRAPAIAEGSSAAVAVDLASGRTLFSRNANVALAPASNEKLTVAYGALVELGPDYRFRTEVLGDGRQVGSVWQGRLVLKGYGDPTLHTADLERLVKELYDHGIRSVTGHVVGDASWFDSKWTAPGWQPGFYPYDSPALSALVVNRGVRKRVIVRDPPLAAAALFDKLLKQRGITARDAVTGTASAGAGTLASVHSKKLANLLELMDADSDNFTAEMVLKAIGAEKAGHGSTAAGARIVRRDLLLAGVPLAGARIVDGSGLSSLDRVTARELAVLLVVFWRSPELHDIVIGSLAVAGESGTLRHRLLGKRTRGIVRGKTGTTNLASALSGYIGSRYAFVLVQNGHPVNWAAAHTMQDTFVERLVKLSPRVVLSTRSR
jgi:D-alanyl-D-alanine carboxypeptidase/D-alanyl-D-alanine-endopeptidase (penicillin-binding protein 4)